MSIMVLDGAGPAPGGFNLVGTDAGKPAAATAGRLYFANDTGIVYRDSGSAWVAVHPLQGAGLAPTTAGSFGYDTTQQKFVGGGGTGTLAGSFPRVLSAQFSTTDQLVAATIGTTETNFATTFSIPANFFIANKVLRVTALFEYVATAVVPTFLLKMRVQKTGPTNVTLYAGPAAAPAAVTVSSILMPFLIQGTAAAGASVSVETAALGAFNGFNKSTTAQGVLITTNVAQTLQFTMTYGAATAGNTVNLRQLIVEELN